MGASAASMMPPAWKQWTGQVVASEFVLREYLGSSADSGCFLTERRGEKALLKLVAENAAHAGLRFSRWEFASSLSHPRLLRLFERGRCRLGDASFLYLVTEYTDDSLAQILPQRALTPDEATEMVRSLIDVLAWLHEQGLVHGRIRPSNLMSQGDVLKFSSDSICPAGGPAISLKPQSLYDAPELATASLAAAADIWSLGMLLVEAFTQKLPVWDPRQGRDPALPAGLPPSVIPARFAEIVRNCLRRDPHRRWTIAEIRAHFERTAPAAPPSSDEIAVLPAPVPRPGLSSAHRFAVPIALGIALLVAVLVARPTGKKSDQQQPASATGRLSTAAELTPHERAPETAPKAAPVAQPPSPSPTPLPAAARPKPAAGVPAYAAAEPVADTNDVETAASQPSHTGVVHEVTPIVAQSARGTITGTIRVRVLVNVDGAGNVTEAKLEDPGPSAYFARLSENAAENWKFAPAAAGSGSRQWRLHFHFRRDGTRVIPAAVNR